MAITTQDVGKLRRIITLAEKLISNSASGPAARQSEKSKRGKRIRRTGKELNQFRKMLKAERRKGVPVAELARKYQISSAYIYMMN